MFTKDEMTEERAQIMLDALEDEKHQVGTALEALKANKVDGDVETAARIKRLENRAKAIDAEIGKLDGSSKSSSSGGAKKTSGRKAPAKKTEVKVDDPPAGAGDPAETVEDETAA